MVLSSGGCSYSFRVDNAAWSLSGLWRPWEDEGPALALLDSGPRRDGTLLCAADPAPDFLPPAAGGPLRDGALLCTTDPGADCLPIAVGGPLRDGAACVPRRDLGTVLRGTLAGKFSL